MQDEADRVRPNNEILLASLARTADAEDEERVREWRRESPANEEEYIELTRLVVLLSRLRGRADAGSPPPAAQLLRVIDDRVSRGSTVGQPAHKTWTRSFRWSLGVAALLILGFGLSRLLTNPRTFEAFGADEFVSSDSDATTVSLRDGTVVRLAPRSRIRLVYTADPGSRRVHLSGRAFLAVAENPERPFVVETSAGTITVLGTRFDVAVQEKNLQVLVVEGRVQLDAWGKEVQVTAGEVARVVNSRLLPVTRIGNPHQETHWMGQFLAFQATPLGEAAAEIEEKFGVSFAFRDPALSERTVTAWFAGWHLEDILAVICTVADVRCTRAGNIIRVEPP